MSNYEEISYILNTMLPEKLITYFNELLLNEEFKDYITNYYSIIELSLNNIIAYEFGPLFESYQLDEAIKKYKELRRVYKRNWFKALEDEISQINRKKKSLLLDEAETIFALKKSIPGMVNLDTFDSNSIETKEDYVTYRFNQMKEWKKSQNSMLIDFGFFNKKRVKAQLSAFIIDLILESLFIIAEDFDGKLDGHTVKYISDFSEYPLFSYRSKPRPSNALTIEKNELVLFDSYLYRSGIIETKLTQSIDEDDASLTTDKILEKYNIEFLGQELDVKDEVIITFAFNQINASTLESNKIIFTLEDMITNTTNLVRIRQEHKDDFEERLFKIKAINSVVHIKDKEDGQAKEKFSVSFFSDVRTYTDSGGSTVVEIKPSDYLLNKYTARQFAQFLVIKYNKKGIRFQAEAILMIMQIERVKAYINHKVEKEFSIEYFRTHFKMINESTSKVRKELEKNLEILMSESSIIETYSIGTNTVVVTFTLLDDIERQLYKIKNNEYLLENRSSS